MFMPMSKIKYSQQYCQLCGAAAGAATTGFLSWCGDIERNL